MRVASTPPTYFPRSPFGLIIPLQISSHEAPTLAEIEFFYTFSNSLNIMKKIIGIIIGLIAIIITFFLVFQKNTEVITPFEDTLFVTQDDLATLRLKYNFIENKDTLNYWKKQKNHTDDLFASEINILPTKNDDSGNAITINIFQRSNEELAKKDFEEIRYGQQKAFARFADINFIDNYQNIGSQNFFVTNNSENTAALIFQYKNYHVNINVISQNIDEAKSQTITIANLFLEKIKKKFNIS